LSSFRPTLLPREYCFLGVEMVKIDLVLVRECGSLGQFGGFDIFGGDEAIVQQQGLEAPPRCDETVVVLYVVSGPIGFARGAYNMPTNYHCAEVRASDN
jgi:hypothetical protein